MRRLLSCATNPISDQRSTRHVQDRVRLFELLSQDLDSFDCRKNQQFDLVTLCLALYFFITGNLPYAPVPMTSWRHFQGMSSAMDSGVCPKSSRNFLDGLFLRSRISPPSMTTSCSYVLPSIWMAPKEKLSKRI